MMSSDRKENKGIAGTCHCKYFCRQKSAKPGKS